MGKLEGIVVLDGRIRIFLARLDYRNSVRRVVFLAFKV